jgi:hypothetical protein
MDDDPSVVRGARYLDEILPGWADTIDLDTLDLGSICDCVLGQLAVDIVPNLVFRSYYEARSHLGIGADQAFSLGFTTLGDFAHLTRAWRDLIIKRRKGNP